MCSCQGKQPRRRHRSERVMLVFCLRKAPTLCVQQRTLFDDRQLPCESPVPCAPWCHLFGLSFCISCFTVSTRVALPADPHKLENGFPAEVASRVPHHQIIVLDSCCIMLCHAFLLDCPRLLLLLHYSDGCIRSACTSFRHRVVSAATDTVTLIACM